MVTDRLVAVLLGWLGRLLRRHSFGAFSSRDSAPSNNLESSRRDSLYAEARACWDAGNHAAARSLLSALLEIDPNHSHARNLLGVIHFAAEDFAAAERLFGQAIELSPNFAGAHNNLGNIFLRREDFARAESCYRAALDCDPNYAEAHNNLGIVYRELGRFDEAIASYQRALSLKPTSAEAHGNLGNALHSKGRSHEALDLYMRALSLKPDYAEALNNCGVALEAMGRYEDALASYGKALAIKPDYVDARYNESLCRLRMGDFARGWEQYEWRWKRKQVLHEQRHSCKPLWLGKEKIAGKTILLHSEQGLGDTIQFCRYATLVAAQGATVLMEVPSPLRSLLSTLKDVSQIAAIGERIPPFDYQCPLMSLPLALKTTLDCVPADVPYLHPDRTAAKAWEMRLSGIKGLRIGLTWAGNPQLGHRKDFAEDRLRSIPLIAFQPLRTVTHARFFSIQKGEQSDQLSRLKSEGWPGPELIDFTEELNDFADTAAFTACMDLVITCDTAMAHLAGAIGKPVWVLSRFNGCWRWLLDRDDSPWYPTARVFRQPQFGDWDSVIEKITDKLRQWPD